MLLLDISEFLVQDVDLSARFSSVAGTKSNIISNEMTSEITRSEVDFSSL